MVLYHTQENIVLFLKSIMSKEMECSMGNIYITNDIISEQTLTKRAQAPAAATPPANPNQGAMPNAQLPQNVIELSKFFMSLHVPKEQINLNTLLSEQTMANQLIREKMIGVFPEMANLMNSVELFKLITASVYQWANTYVPKTPVKV